MIVCDRCGSLDAQPTAAKVFDSRQGNTFYEYGLRETHHCCLDCRLKLNSTLERWWKDGQNYWKVIRANEHGDVLVGADGEAPRRGPGRPKKA